MTEARKITIAHFLTNAEIQRCFDLYRELASTGRFAITMADKIITPNLKRIDEALGQANDAYYLAYCVEYAIMQSDRPQKVKCPPPTQ